MLNYSHYFRHVTTVLVLFQKKEKLLTWLFSKNNKMNSKKIQKISNVRDLLFRKPGIFS